jgi:3-hydroxyacyl-CoA dehydrogenase
MLNKLFNFLTGARPAGSAPAAVSAGIFRKTDGVSLNREYLIHDAKQDVLEMVHKRFIAPRPAQIRVLGAEGWAGLSAGAYMMKEGNFISAYDEQVARKLAYALSGGKIVPNSKVDEAYLLDLEREAFIDLICEAKTVERIESVITSGKPVKN